MDEGKGSLDEVAFLDAAPFNKNEDVVLILRGIDAPAKLITGGLEGEIEFRFFNGHLLSRLRQEAAEGARGRMIWAICSRQRLTDRIF